jgi:hypothetical protein
MPGDTQTQHTGTRTTVISAPFADKDGAQQQVVSKIYAHSGDWTVFDVTWTDANGNARTNLKVHTYEYREAISGD